MLKEADSEEHRKEYVQTWFMELKSIFKFDSGKDLILI